MVGVGSVMIGVSPAMVGGRSRGNIGVTEFTVWTGLRLFLTSSHNVKELPVKWEVLEHPCEKMFVTMGNGL
jgi:hypothetical protein